MSERGAPAGLVVAAFAVVALVGRWCGGAAAAAPVDPHGEEVLERARAREAEELKALAGTSFEMHTQGTVREGSKTRMLEALRLLRVAKDGVIHNDYGWGKLDGAQKNEDELREAAGAPKKPPREVESLTIALAPLTDREVEATPVGPRDGGYLIRCRVHREAAIKELDLIVDEATGHKKSATLLPKSPFVKLAKEVTMALDYGSDGAPARMHTRFRVHLLWFDREADLTTVRRSTSK